MQPGRDTPNCVISLNEVTLNELVHIFESAEDDLKPPCYQGRCQFKDIQWFDFTIAKVDGEYELSLTATKVRETLQSMQ